MSYTLERKGRPGGGLFAGESGSLALTTGMRARSTLETCRKVRIQDQAPLEKNMADKAAKKPVKRPSKGYRKFVRAQKAAERKLIRTSG